MKPPPRPENISARLLVIIFAAIGLVVALLAGIIVGQGSYFPVALILGSLIFGCFFALFGRHATTEGKILALLIFGYTVAQRLFAEINLGRFVFIGEIGLAILICLVIARIAFHRVNPFPPDALTLPIVLILFIAICRFLLVDRKEYGMMAARDFATVYYAAFYFIGYVVGANENSSSLVRGAFRWGMIVYVPLLLLLKLIGHFSQSAEWFAAVLGTRDMASIVPVAATLLCITASAFPKRRFWPLIIAVVPLILVMLHNERSSYLALLVGLVLTLYVISRNNFDFLGRLVASALILALAVGVMFIYSLYSHEHVLDPVLEKTASIVDIQAIRERDSAVAGSTSTGSEETNRWRTTWWQIVFDETMSKGPVFGLGFGYDLARTFTMEYYGQGPAEVTARNPHNIFFTFLGRLGLTGAILFLWFTFLVVRNVLRTARAVRRRKLPMQVLELWLVAFVILIVAYFSHTLEGPMAAIPFWSFLGLAMAEKQRAFATRQASRNALRIPEDDVAALVPA